MAKRGGRRIGKPRRKGCGNGDDYGQSSEWPFRAFLNMDDPWRLSAGTDVGSFTLDRFGRISAKFGPPEDALADTRRLTDVDSIVRKVRAIPTAAWVIAGLLMLLLAIAWSQR